MTDDAMKRAFEAYWDALRSHPFIEMDSDMDAAMDDYEAGWNDCKAHYAEVLNVSAGQRLDEVPCDTEQEEWR